MGIDKDMEMYSILKEIDCKVRKVRLKRKRGRETARETTILQCSKEARKKEKDGVSVGIKRYGYMTAEASRKINTALTRGR